MARVAGIDLPGNKSVAIALTSVYGIGRATAMKLTALTNVTASKKSSELTDAEVQRLTSAIEAGHKVEGILRQDIFKNIKRLKDIRAYRGIRHKVGLPARGQNTRSNGVTRKGKNMAVGGLKRTLEKT